MEEWDHLGCQKNRGNLNLLQPWHEKDVKDTYKLASGKAQLPTPHKLSVLYDFQGSIYGSSNREATASNWKCSQAFHAVETPEKYSFS